MRAASAAHGPLFERRRLRAGQALFIDDAAERGRRATGCAEDGDAGTELIRALRALGVAAALAPDSNAEVYAAGWDYSHVLNVSRGRAALKRRSTGSAHALDGKTAPEIAQFVAAHLRMPEEC